MHVTSLLLTLLPITLAFSDPVVHERSRSRGRSAHAKKDLVKRQTYGGRATFYDVGLGACGWNNVASDYIVALNTAQYGGGYPGPNCGRSITISANGVQVQAQIADQCPSCGYGDLDLSRSLFNRFASPDAGVFQMSWWYNDGNSQPQQQPTTTEQPTPTSTYTPPTSTYTPPTSTYTPPTSTSTPAPTTSTADAPSSAVISSSSSQSGVPIASGTSINGTMNPFVVTSGSANITASATSSADGSTPSDSIVEAGSETGNLVLFNQAVTYLGNIVVVGASQ